MTLPFQSAEKWDVHTHTTLSPATYQALGRFTHYADFIRIRAHETKPCCAEMVNGDGEVQRVIEDNAYDGVARLTDCDRHGVTMQVLSPTPMMIPDYVDNPEDAAAICQILNDDNAATVAAHPDRFVALGALPMLFPDLAIAEMERIVREHGMRGIEVNSNVNGLDLDDPGIFPVFEAAAELGVAVFVHPWGGFMSPQEERLQRRMNASRNWRPWLVGMGMETALAFDAMRSGRVHERLPHLRVLYAHGGGAFAGLAGRLEHGAYCRPDLFAESSPLNSYQTIEHCGVYTDTLTHNPWQFAMLLELLGAERIAMGSDYPYPLGEIDPFDAETLRDPKGNKCPYDKAKGIYPGHMVEHLPGTAAETDTAWGHFNWLPRTTRDGTARSLPCLTDTQKQRILSGTAQEWLGIA